jgi:hypothetical protein
MKPTHEEIAERANEIWERQKRPRYSDYRIWMQAQAELTNPAGNPDTGAGGNKGAL